MVCFFPVYILPATRRFPVVILALSWVCGLFAGTYIALSADSSFPLVMRPILSESVSIVSLLLVHLLPLLFSAFAVMISHRWLLHFFAAWEAFLLSYIAVGLALCFGNSGWLPAMLLLASNVLSSCVMLWYWISSWEHPVSGYFRHFFLAAALIVFISALDYRFILPFLLDLFRI